MKKIYLLAGAVLLMGMQAGIYAADVGTLNQFTTGDVISSSAVNSNFDDLKAGVNSKQDKLTTRYMSIPGVAFQNRNIDAACIQGFSSGGTYFDRIAGGGTEFCDAYAAVILPDGAVVSSFTCEMLDNKANVRLLVQMQRATGGVFSALGTVQTEYVDASATLVEKTDGATNFTVDNLNYIYYIYLLIQVNSAVTMDDTLRLNKCYLEFI